MARQPYALLTVFALAGLCTALPLAAQEVPLDRVLILHEDRGGARDLPLDQGATGLWQKLQKLHTTASALHTLGHPDDEHGGLLTYLSRGRGVRTAQVTLNRGEGGANALGSELFDALGLMRTEELLTAGAYYGLDDLYFTTVIDYGFSKTLDEALRNWGKENVLRDLVRVIRLNRPLVVIARFHGSERDGHGHHQAAGVLTQEAFHLAGDPNAFPEQIAEEGLRPWQPRKLYRGGIQEGEPFHVQLDVNTYSPWLGQTYRNFASRGLSYQRSQVSGIFREATGPYIRRYERLYPEAGPAQESGFFDGLDTSLSGLFTLLGVPAPQGATARLQAIQRHLDAATDAFDVRDPAAVVPSLAQGLAQTREAIRLAAGQPDAAFVLAVKERQFEDAISTALGLRLSAVASPGEEAGSDSPWAPPATMGDAVPGEAFQVEATLVNPSPVEIAMRGLNVTTAFGSVDVARPAGVVTFAQVEAQDQPVAPATLSDGAVQSTRFLVRLSDDAPVSRSYFYRDDIRESRYQVRDEAARHRPHQRPPFWAEVQYEVAGVPVALREPVRRRQADLPYGHSLHTLKVVPAVAVNVRPEQRVVPVSRQAQVVPVQVEVVGNRPGGVSGVLRLETPGWTVAPAEQPFTFEQAGERRTFSFGVTVPPLEDRSYEIRAVATAGGKTYTEGYDALAHRDTDTNYLYRPAVTRVRGVEAALAPDLAVGYVMGVGDAVPEGIQQLGATVDLLDADDLATGDLSRYDAIVVGTRAYAVRQDLLTYNRRLFDFAAAGGNLIVLYQTPEFDPRTMAPIPAELTRRAEETSEEDAPMTILAPDHPAFNRPNRITPADFDGWVEQRGSKFLSAWDDAYVPMVETYDRGQDPQRGVWLTAPYGQGYYSYFSLAVHRQLPYGVPGAYRIFANLLSLGQEDS